MNLSIGIGHPGAEEVLEIRAGGSPQTSAVLFTIYRPVDNIRFALVDNAACEMDWFDDVASALHFCNEMLRPIQPALTDVERDVLED